MLNVVLVLTISSRQTKQKSVIPTHVWLFPHRNLYGNNQTCVGITIICGNDQMCLVISTYIDVWEFPCMCGNVNIHISIMNITHNNCL